MHTLLLVLSFIRGFYSTTSLSASSAPSTLKNYQVVFRVDMSEELKTRKQLSKIGIRGSIKPLSWDKTYSLTDQDKDGVYEATIGFTSTGDNLRIEYKYILNDTIWESSSNRMATLTTSGIKLPVDTFNLNNKPEPKFSPQEIKDDLTYLYKTLQQSHYDLYTNNGKDVFDNKYSLIYKAISDSLTAIQTIRLFKPLIALAQHAHCTINFPSQLYFDRYVNKGGTLLPLNASVSDKHVYITHVYSVDSVVIRKGDEIMAINGIAMSQYLDRMYSFMSAESHYLINTLIDVLTFPRVHWWVYDKSDKYELAIRTQDGKTKKIIVKSLPAAQVEGYLQKTSVFDQSREFKFIDKIAYLRPGIFMNLHSSGNTSEQNTFKRGEFLQFLDSALVKVSRAKSQSLIIDLRGNPGGDNSFSDPMIAYFATKPFWFCSEFRVKTSPTTKKFWKEVEASDPFLVELKNKILTYKNGDTFNVSLTTYPPRTDSLRFTGKVYVLINRYSYSNTVATAAIIKDYHFALLLGEPTADVATGHGAIHEIALPKTDIRVVYPKALIVRPSGDRTSQGVVPDIQVLDDLSTKEDEVIEKVVELIRKGE